MRSGWPDDGSTAGRDAVLALDGRGGGSRAVGSVTGESIRTAGDRVRDDDGIGQMGAADGCVLAVNGRWMKDIRRPGPGEIEVS
jgi:hypothetical protein